MRNAVHPLLLLTVAAGATACADCFFSAKGRLVDCATQAPLANATVTVHVDDGIHGAHELAQTFTTDASGGFDVQTGATETCDSTVTVTFQKDGFTAASKQLVGAPKVEVTVCLDAI